MELIFLGTGAADWPEEKGELAEFRRNASALLDRQLLIDPGPGVLPALSEYGLDPAGIRYILNTHRHADHFRAETVEALAAAGGAQLLDLKAGETVRAGAYTVQTLAANHGTCREAVHFLISDGKSRLFYGLDGAWLLYDEVQAILKNGVDYAVLDGTVGRAEGDYRIFEHNNLRMVEEMKRTLAPYVKRFCISHMARTLHPDHGTLAADMEKSGIETAYDGLAVTF